jgi:hypothetical protein
MSANVPYLEVMDGDQKGTQYRLLGEMVLVGRAPECDIHLEDNKGVSRRHAQIFLMDGRVRVKDLESQNGTFVDGTRASEAIVPPGSVIKIGQVSLRLVLPDQDAPAAAPVPAGDKGMRRAESRTGSSRLASGAARPASAVGARPAGGVPGPIDGQAVDVESLMLAAGQGSRSLVLLLVIIAAVVGSLYAVSVLLAVVEPTFPAYRVVQVRQEQIVGVPTPFAAADLDAGSKTQEGMAFVRVERYRGLLAERIDDVNVRNANNGDRQMHFLVVTGQARTPERSDAVILLRSKSGEVVQDVHILVRGALPPDIPDRITSAEARDLADQWTREARYLEENSQPFEAMQKLDKVVALCRSQRMEDRVNDADRVRLRLKGKLKEDLGRLFTEAMALAFPDKSGLHPPKLKEAFLALENAKQIVPDEDGQEWQVLNLWQAELRKMMRK